MDINFIITCYNREDYWVYLKEVFASYKKINPTIFLCYNGNKDYFNCDLRIKNLGHQQGEYSLITLGYQLSKNYNENFRFVKLSVDSWLLDEDKIIEIFNRLEETEAPYAGTTWGKSWLFSTDIFFADIRFGNVFEELKFDSGAILEKSMWDAVSRINKGFVLLNRVSGIAKHAYKLEEYGWVYSHDINQNVKEFQKFKEDGLQLEYKTITNTKRSLKERLLLTKNLWLG